jgi:NAD-dependent deacetylase
MGLLKTVITQNIDNLHQRAGSRSVLELHGHLRTATCIRCYDEVPVDSSLEDRVRKGRVPHCKCGGVLKPNVILFGEQLPIGVLNQARREARCCDLILVAGSSLTVTPAADIPHLAVNSGATAIVVNFQPTDLDRDAELVLHGDVAEILPQIVKTLEKGGM